MIKWIIIALIIIVALSYFNINLRGIVESPAGQANFAYVQTVSLNLWNSYLAQPLGYLWQEAIQPLWGFILEAGTNLKNGLK